MILTEKDVRAQLDKGYKEALGAKMYAKSLKLVTVARIVFWLKYPGKKAAEDKHDFFLDVRMGSIRMAPVHADIVLDIYTRCTWCKTMVPNLKAMLSGLYHHHQDYIGPPEAMRHTDQSLVDEARKILAKVGKKPCKMYHAYPMMIDELSMLIFLLGIQENINYPPPKYQGRRMPLERYFEAIHCAGSGRDIMDVVKRSAEGWHRQWPEVDYGSTEI